MKTSMTFSRSCQLQEPRGTDSGGKFWNSHALTKQHIALPRVMASYVQLQ